MVQNNRGGVPSYRHHPVQVCIAAIVAIGCLLAMAVKPFTSAFAEGEPYKISTENLTITVTHAVKDTDGNPVYENGSIKTETTTLSGPNIVIDPNEYYFKNQKPSYAINLDFNIPEGTLTPDNPVAVMQLPQGFTYEVQENRKFQNGNLSGTYSVSADGLVTLTYDSDTVTANNSMKLEQTFSYDLAISEQAQQNGSSWNENGISVSIKKFTDISVSKNVSDSHQGHNDTICPTEGAFCYSIRVESTTGTNEIHLEDILPEGYSGKITNIKVIKKNAGGNPTDGSFDTKNDEGSLSWYLPPLGAAEAYEITYEYKLDADDLTYGDHKLVNTAKVTTKNDHDKTIVDIATAEKTYTKEGPKVNKAFVTENEDGDFTWKVTINENKKDLEGWKLEDSTSDNHALVVDSVVIYEIVDGERSGEDKEIELPYTFSSEDNGKVYEVEYLTRRDPNNNNTYFTNTAKLTKGDSTSQGDAGHQSGTPAGNTSTKKTGVLVEDGSTDRKKILEWTVTISNPKGLAAGWSFQDTLQQINNASHYFTEKQWEEAQANIKKAFTDLSMDEPTSMNPNTSGSGYGSFTFTSPDPLPAKKSLVFTFHSTVECTQGTFNDASGKIEIANNAKVEGENDTTAKVIYAPPIESEITKTASNNNQSYDSLQKDNNGKPYVKWTIRWMPGSELIKKASGDDQFTVTLNEVLQTKGLAFLPLNPEPVGLKMSNLQKANVSIGNNGLFADGNAYASDNTTVLATAQLAEDKRSIEIVLTNALLKAMGGDVDAWDSNYGNRASLDFEVAAYVPEPEACTQDKCEHSYGNKVQWESSDKEDSGEANSTQIVYTSAGGLNKAVRAEEQYGQLNLNNNEIPYEVEVNPTAACRNGEVIDGMCTGEPITVTDTATYSNYRANSYLRLANDSVRVYEDMGEPTAGACPAGSEQYHSFNSNQDICIKPVEDFGVEASKDHTDRNNYKEILTFTVPDGKHLYLVYTYKVSGTTNDWASITNKAEMDGIRSKDIQTQLQIVKSAVTIYAKSISIIKVEEGKINKLLPGAQFKLWEYNGTEFVPAQQDGKDVIVTTNNKGRIDLTDKVYEQFDRDIAYAFEEIAAPSGYVLPENEANRFTYFILRNSTKEGPRMPEGYLQGYQGHTVHVFEASDPVAAELQIENKLGDNDSVMLPQAGGTGMNSWLWLSGFILVGIGLMLCNRVARRE